MTVDFIGRGWAFPLGVQANGAIATSGGVTRLEQAMRIILSTHLGERPMRPLFGSRLRDFLFAGVDDASTREIALEVARAIGSCEPRVEVDHVDVVNEARNLVVPFYSIPGEEG